MGFYGRRRTEEQRRAYWSLVAPAFKCLDCGEVFEAPAEWVESHGFRDGPYERMAGCPVCGGAFEEVDDLDDWREIIGKQEE